MMITPPMLEAIFALKPGEVTPVTQTPFGFELLKVEERKMPRLEEVRQEVDDRIRQEKYDAVYQDLKSRNAVKTESSYFGTAASSNSAREKAMTK
jgi:parvulin-like peptidyl-prolyl isomerase